MNNYDNDDKERGNLHKQSLFCQICNRQCHDKDGFICHLKTVTHKRNIEKVSKNPDFYINNYSQEFETGFLDVLKREFPIQFVSANKVYQEYISDKESTHLNATRWTTLSGFISSMEKIGKCETKINDKETLIKFVDLSQKKIEKKFLEEKKLKEGLVEEKKQKIHNLKLMEKVNNQTRSDKKSINDNNFVDIEKLKNFSFELKTNANVDLRSFNDVNPKKEEFLKKKRFNSQLKSEIPNTQKIKHDIDNDKPDNSWIQEGLIVRIKDNKLQIDKKDLYNTKGIIIAVENYYIATVKLMKQNIMIKIDQALLEPVIPGLVPNSDIFIKVISGKYKGYNAKLLNLNIKEKFAEIEIEHESTSIREIINLSNICKFQ